jgi:hypothetical protein
MSPGLKRAGPECEVTEPPVEERTALNNTSTVPLRRLGNAPHTGLSGAHLDLD